MPVELSKEARVAALASLQRFCEEKLERRIGNLEAGEMLDFILEEIGPAIHNRAVGEILIRLQTRLADLEGELLEDEFQFWPRHDRRRKPPRN